jgi:hypothetical protein
MEQPETWRDLLAEIICDPQEKQRLVSALNIRPITLTRWIEGRSTPRPENLRQLVSALPAWRKQFIELLEDAPGIINLNEDPEPEIPSAFYARTLHANTTTPPQLRATTICNLILNQLTESLDPYRRGLALLILQCMPPDVEGKVRSMRIKMGRCTEPWQDIDGRSIFFGAESQAGHTLRTGQATAFQRREERERLFPIHTSTYEESSAVFPLLFSGCIAGCLTIVSTQPLFFTQARMKLIRCYVDLLVLAFDAHEFYDLSKSVELKIMPSFREQLPYIATFHNRVTQRAIANATNRNPFTYSQIEDLVWREIEEDLLSLSLSSKM